MNYACTIKSHRKSYDWLKYNENENFLSKDFLIITIRIIFKMKKKTKKIFCHTTSIYNNHTTVTPQFSCKNTSAFCVIPNCHKTFSYYYFIFCFIFVIRSFPKLWNVIFVNYIIKFHSKRKLISVWNVSWKTALEELLILLTLGVMNLLK